MTTSPVHEAAFPVGVTIDFAGAYEGDSDVGLQMLDDAGLAWEFVAPEESGALGPTQLSAYSAILTGPARVTAEALDAARPAPLLLARFGIGTDMLDLGACTRHDVIVSITPDATARPVAVAALALVLASTLRMHAKDVMAREGDWVQDRRRWLGCGLVGRTVGIIGFGNIGTILADLLRPLEVRIVVCDPYRQPEDARRLGVELIGLPELLDRSDVVVVACPLTDETRHMIGPAELARMRPSASLVNVARGQILDQGALTVALANGVISGAGLDVFEQEPLPASDPLTSLPNVMLSPHGLSQTDQLMSDSGASAVRAILDVKAGRAPRFVANRAVLERPGLLARLKSRRQRRDSARDQAAG
jgi:phosphoglycerate dehydrogenase-like enzyme